MRVAVLLCSLLAISQDPIRSGPQPGSRPGPYAMNVVTGPKRGVLHCYIRETADKPAVIVFARTATDTLGKLAAGIDKAVIRNKEADLRSWITFLHPDLVSFDPKLVQWARQHAVANVPLAVVEDLAGPPGYTISKDADVTVILSVKQKVVANFAFRAGELTDARVEEVLKAVDALK